MKPQEEIRIFFATTLITSWSTTRDGADALISSKLAHLLPAMKTLYKLTQTLQLADEAQSWTFSSFHGLKYTGKNRLQSTGFLEALVQEKLKALQSLPKNQPETIITLISQAL